MDIADIRKKVGWYCNKEPSIMNIEEIKAKVAGIKWFHSIDLGNGIVTPGLCDYREVLPKILDSDLSGKSVLDIGAWDGFYSFEAKKRGAKRVVALDRHIWESTWSGNKPNSKMGFELVRKVTGLAVEDIHKNLEETTVEETGGPFDLVLYLGVLYHMQNPMDCLNRVYQQAKDEVVVESHYDCDSIDYPCGRFYPGRELNGDSSNWWGLNDLAIKNMMEVVGFKDVQRVYKKSHDENRGRVVIKARR